MKVISLIRVFASVAALVAVGGPSAYAQAEIDPDHFDAPSVRPIDEPKAAANTHAETMQYAGKFTLPYSVQCRGKNLAPGNYSVFLRSDGKKGLATLNQQGRAVAIAGVIRKSGLRHGNDGLMVELRGRTRRLAVIQVAEIECVFDSDPLKENSYGRKSRRLDRLPLTETLQQN